MSLEEIIKQLNLEVLTPPKEFGKITPSSGYASDLLSCVMTGAHPGSIWVTLQAHINIVAVAALLDISAVIITENAMPDEETISKASLQEVNLLRTDKPTYVVAGLLWELGLKP